MTSLLVPFSLSSIDTLSGHIIMQDFPQELTIVGSIGPINVVVGNNRVLVYLSSTSEMIWECPPKVSTMDEIQRFDSSTLGIEILVSYKSGVTITALISKPNQSNLAIVTDGNEN